MQDDPNRRESALPPNQIATMLPGSRCRRVLHRDDSNALARSRPRSPDGPICSIIVNDRWRVTLTDIARCCKTPLATGPTTGSFVLARRYGRTPSTSSRVDLVAIEGTTLHARGLDCLDGTPLIDLKLERTGSAGSDHDLAWIDMDGAPRYFPLAIAVAPKHRWQRLPSTVS
jgi:hypothetical protein